MYVMIAISAAQFALPYPGKILDVKMQIDFVLEKIKIIQISHKKWNPFHCKSKSINHQEVIRGDKIVDKTHSRMSYLLSRSHQFLRFLIHLCNINKKHDTRSFYTSSRRYEHHLNSSNALLELTLEYPKRYNIYFQGSLTLDLYFQVQGSNNARPKVDLQIHG